MKSKGEFRYLGKDNYEYVIDYTLDENGFKSEIYTLLNDEDVGNRISSSALASLAGGGLG